MWRDFFPFLKWIPQRNFERKIEKMEFGRLAVMKALIKEQSERAASGVISTFTGVPWTRTSGPEKPEEWNPDRFHDDEKKYAPSDLYKTMAWRWERERGFVRVLSS
ncbi:hypothetical protein RHSIM_Rhsim07G0233800 [Rhododendron simsii]|uniref:Uncharacterized protein n=1 Tax=Rhododendron simsii TaxID=118357 RepID=A0A834GPK4_RHOSS|nr:hypothetical protein RHSIM_Rhsim07G0233800 [Rhododendron simsii]